MIEASQARARRKPRALRRGDTLGLIAPSGSTKDRGAAARGIAALEAMGFSVRAGRSCLAERYGYLAADDELRAQDINEFFADPAIDGIVCFKGGYGTPRILDRIDYAIVRENPKAFIGYSDITALHLAFARYAGFPTYHGLMAMSMLGGADDFSVEAWLGCVLAEGPLGTLAYPPASADSLAPRPEALVGGQARGILMGGNLSLVAALAGTPYALEPEGTILFLEDVGEEPYRIDRMLTNLRLSGVFERCAGVLLGGWTNCEPEDPERSLSLRKVFEDVIAPSGKPLLMGFPAGHCVPTLCLPLGVEAALDADAGTLTMLEAACE
jgi:muramoyltetrapeptide carboxypeptidase